LVTTFIKKINIYSIINKLTFIAIIKKNRKGNRKGIMVKIKLTFIAKNNFYSTFIAKINFYSIIKNTKREKHI
jgi:hypothetical protein